MSGPVQRAALAVVVAIATLGLMGCGDDDNASSSSTTEGTKSSTSTEGLTPTSFTSDFSAMKGLTDLAKKGKGKVAVLLPDTTTSARYESFDRPYLQQAFEAAGLTADQYSIDNAQGSASTMQTQADAAITDGATVLLVDAIDSGSGAAIESNAESKGVRVIDYDRLVKGGPENRIYVSFDNVNVGKQIGEGAVDCITKWKVKDPNVLVMSGDPTDNNAKLFAQGYNGVLKKYFDDGTYKNAGEPAGTWTPSEAATTFEQAYTDDPSINAAITPNDDNANAVIAQLQAKAVPPNTFPTTGQDASLPGLQNILKGYQCGTVYKPIYLEAQAAAAAALYYRAGEDLPKGLVNGTTEDDQTGQQVDSVLLGPTWVTTENMADTVVKDKAVNVSELCIVSLQSACTAAGIS